MAPVACRIASRAIACGPVAKKHVRVFRSPPCSSCAAGNWAGNSFSDKTIRRRRNGRRELLPEMHDSGGPAALVSVSLDDRLQAFAGDLLSVSSNDTASETHRYGAGTTHVDAIVPVFASTRFLIGSHLFLRDPPCVPCVGRPGQAFGGVSQVQADLGFQEFDRPLVTKLPQIARVTCRTRIVDCQVEPNQRTFCERGRAQLKIERAGCQLHPRVGQKRRVTRAGHFNDRRAEDDGVLLTIHSDDVHGNRRDSHS